MSLKLQKPNQKGAKLLFSKQRTTRKTGSALVIVLWLVMLMTTVAVVTAKMAILESRISQIASERIRCRWAARAGVETAWALLLADDRASDTKLDNWSQNDAELVDVPLYGCQFTVKVTDESSKLNINTVTETQLAYLPDMTEDILNSILDWRDTDDETRPNGAEAGYYLTLPNAYYCRNGSLVTIRELLRVKGVTADFFYGPSTPEEAWSENEGWVHYFTCHSAQPNIDSQQNPKVNINQAQQDELINTLSFSRSEAQWILNNRPFQTLVSLTEGTAASSASSSAQTSTTRTTTTSASRSGSTGSSGSSSAGRQSGSANQSGASRSTQTQGVSGGTSSSSNRQTGTAAGSGSQTQGSAGQSAAAGTSRSSQSSTTTTGQTRSSSQQAGTPPSWQSVLSKADQIAFSSETVLPGKVNVNTAPLMVLYALLEGQRQLAENILAHREGRSVGFATLEDLGQVEGMTETILKQIIDQVDVRSSVFSISSKAVSDATGQTYTLEAILNRDEQNGRFLYWREQQP